jgi:glycosyltransferase involved in cell wall biosynthesis
MALRLVIVAPWGERLGGAEEMLLLALRHLDRERIEPSVVFLGPGAFEREVAELGFPTAVIPATRLRRVGETGGAIVRLARILRRTKPDLLLNWSAKTQIYGAPAAAIAGMPGRVVWWQHQIPEGHWTERLATALPARAVGCSSRAGSEGQERCSPRRRCFVVTPGVELDDSPAQPRAGLREELGIPPQRVVIGLVGRLQPWKGQDRLLRALAQLRGEGCDVHGLFVGGDAYDLSPEYAEGLKRLVPELGLEGFVALTGQVPDARPYISLMDVAVNASDPEPFGIVLIEAMAARVPVVAVACGGPLDVVEPGVTGNLAESGEPAALATAIKPLLGDADLRTAMGLAGEKRCRERFGATAMAENLAEQLERVARG